MNKWFAKQWIAILCLLVGIALAAPMLYAQDDDNGPVDPTVAVAPPTQFVKPADMLKMINDKDTSVVLVDTQPAESYAEAHIVGAINYPWVQQVRPPIALPRNKTLVFYCACNHDEDSIDMTHKLAEFGYYNVKVLEGGWFKWEALKYPEAGTDTASAAAAVPASFKDSSDASAAPASAAAPATADAAAPAATSTGPLASGRPVGAVTPSFRVIDVTGKYKGQETCYVCEYGEAPTILAFFDKPSDQAADLIVKLNSLVAKDSSKNLKGVVVMVNGDESKPWLEKLAADKNIQIPMVYLLKGPKDLGVRLYKINTAATNTFLVNDKRTVQTNLVNVTDNDFNQVSDATTKMLGGE